MLHGLDQQVGLVLPVCGADGGQWREKEKEKRGLWKRGLEKMRRGDDNVQIGCPSKKAKVENLARNEGKTRS